MLQRAPMPEPEIILNAEVNLMVAAAV